jgi:hypothetical protein
MQRDMVISDFQLSIHKLLLLGYHPVAITTYAASDSVITSKLSKLQSKQKGGKDQIAAATRPLSFQLKSLRLPSEKNHAFYNAVEQITQTFENEGRGGTIVTTSDNMHQEFSTPRQQIVIGSSGILMSGGGGDKDATKALAKELGTAVGKAAVAAAASGIKLAMKKC